MRARRDQVQAYRFVIRRLVAAMLSSEPESAEQPLRRLFLAGIVGVMVTAVLFAVVGVWGLTHPGGTQAWKHEMTIVIERETGARFVYSGGVLHPTVNYASARLLVGNPYPRQKTVSGSSLAGTPRGVPLGISGAPDSLPDRTRMLDPLWSVCGVSGGPTPGTRVVLGELPAGGKEQPANGETASGEAAGGEVLGGNGILVTAGASTYLLTGDRRLRVPDKTTLIALDLLGSTAIPVRQALIDGITAGPDLGAPTIAGFGEAGRPVSGKPSRIGQVYRSGGQHYVLLASGLAPVGDVTARLLTADGRRPVEVSAADVAAVLADDRVEPDGFPHTAPPLRVLDGGRAAICVTYRGDIEESTRVEVYPKVPERLARVGDPERLARVGDAVAAVGRDGGREVARTGAQVLVPGGRGTLVQASPAPGAPPTGTIYLVTDHGFKFALVDSARVALGYGNVPPVAVPAAFLDMIPTGPVLDPDAARRPAYGAAG